MSDLSTADIADRHRRYMAFAMFTVALIYGARAAEYLASPGWVDALEAVQILGALVTVACIAPMMLWKIRNRDGDLRYLYLSEDGYVAQALNRAKGASWVATFVLLCGLAQAAKDLDGVPSEIFIQIAIAVMLAVFSIVFLVMDPSDRELESDRA